MKYFVILLVVVGFISIANAQYVGNVDFYHKSVNTGFDQHSVLMQSESTKFTKAMFDQPAEALIFSISTSSDMIDTATITMNKQTMSQLFSGLEDDPSNMVLLINGEVKPYRIIADNKMVSWMFYVPTESTQVELIPPTSMFEPVKSSEDIPFNVLRTYPPVKQNHVDVSYEDIKCKENLVLLQKYDGSPACVTESTKQKLIERGWTQSLPPCTSDRTACFNQESNICDPSGWECGDNGEIFSEIISIPESKKHSTVFPYIWNDYLHKQGIEFEPRNQSYWNTGEGWLDINRVCSPIVTSNGTELYISSVFMAEPFEIIGTFIDNTKPDDCHKIWKTESVLPEPDKELEAWLEIYHNNK